MEQTRLTVRQKLGFGVGDVGGNLFFTVIAFWLPVYLTDTVGLLAGLMGTALLVGRIWDAAIDPLIGYVSDRTRSRWGRRRPYILFASAPLMVAMVVMFTSPGFASQTGLFVWALLMLTLLVTMNSLVNVNYSSLTPELTRDFHERTVLNGYRMSFAVVGTLIGAGAAMPLVGLFASKATGFSVMGVVFGAVMAAAALTVFLSVREPKAHGKVAHEPFFRAYLQALRNPPFLLLLIPWALFTTGVTVVSGMVSYYFRYIYEQEGMATIALLLLLVTSLVCIPIWVRISRKVEKRDCYTIGMLIFTAALVAFFFIGPRLGVTSALVIMVVGGVGFATHYVMPWALAPDAIEYDYARTGSRREGIHYGMWTFLSQLGQALGGALVGWILGASGYVANVAQTDSALLGIRLLFGPIPAVFFICGVLVLRFYPIDRRMYRGIMERVAKMEAEETSSQSS